MLKFQSLSRWGVPVVLLGATALAADTDRKVLADFESVASGDAVAPGAEETARPWRRFGEATLDNIVATTAPAKVLGGKVSASYPLGWPARFGIARMVADAPIDLGVYKTATLLARSDRDKTATTVCLQISDGHTTFETKAPQPLTGQAMTLKFPLTAAAMARVDGLPADFAKVLAGVTEIGFKLASDGSTYTENVLFDDLAVEK